MLVYIFQKARKIDSVCFYHKPNLNIILYFYQSRHPMVSLLCNFHVFLYELRDEGMETWLSG